MYYLEDICFLCLKNNVELYSLFIQDNDGIAFNEKLRCCFPEIFDSTSDADKIACLECLAKLRFLYESKQSVICSSTVMRNYLDNLQCENKTFQQPSVVLSARKRRRKDSNTKNLPQVEVENVGNSFKLKIKNLNLKSTNDEKLNTIEHSCQPTTNENIAFLTEYNCLTEAKDLETKNVEKIVPFTETETINVKQESQFLADDSTASYLDKETKNSKGAETIYIKQELQFSEDDSTSYLDNEVEDSEESTSSNEDDPDFEGDLDSEDDPDPEISEEGTSRPDNYNNQKVNGIPLKPLHVSDAKFCNTCQDLLFEDLNNINLHLHIHIQSSNCFRCKDSFKDIHKFQRHMFNHCEPVVEMLDKGERGEKFSCTICDQQFNEFSNLRKHILNKYITSLTCVVCSKVFTSKPNLLRHILVTHCHIKLYKCKICPTRFTSQDGIKEHMIYVHYSDKICVCNYCDQTFQNLGTLRNHISKVHETVLRLEEQKLLTYDSSKISDATETLTCPICHKQLYNVYYLKRHLYDNHVKSMECEICSKTYTRRTSIVNHILRNHCCKKLKLYNCNICVKKFIYKKSYTNHMIQMHSNDNSGAVTEQVNKVMVTENRENFSCGICGIQFDDFESSKKHIYDKHMPGLNCVICYSSYSRKEELHRHILEQHCNVKLFECRICSKQFISNESFKNHMNRKHNDSNTTTEPENKVVPVTLNGQKVTCTICHKQFDFFKSLKRHIYDEHIIDLNCVVCSKTCSSKPTLNRHIMKTHCHLKITNCKLCPQRFVCKRILEDHMNQQHSTDKFGAMTEVPKRVLPVTLINGEKVTCIICKKQFDVLQNLRRHIYDEHMTGLDCVICSRTNTCKSALNRHIIRQHCNLKIINCEFCPQRFVSKESLNYHVNQQHVNDKVGGVTKLDNEVSAVTELDNNVGAVIKTEEIFIKEDPHYSDEYYSSDEEYEADNYEIEKDLSNFAMAEESNSRTSNSEEVIGSSIIPNATATTKASYCEPGALVNQSDVCHICHKMFLYLSNLTEHLNTHLQESSCSMCKDSAENISRLQRHMLTPCQNTSNTQNDDIVTCVVCQQKFKYIILKKHMFTHITNLTCVVCNKTCTIRQNLCRHLLDHCKFKPFQCELCGKKFTAKESLKYHMHTGHSSRVVCCQHCQKTMKSTKTLRTHIIRNHPDETHRCEVCKRIFLHRNELEKHAKFHIVLQ